MYVSKSGFGETIISWGIGLIAILLLIGLMVAIGWWLSRRKGKTLPPHEVDGMVMNGKDPVSMTFAFMAIGGYMLTFLGFLHWPTIDVWPITLGAIAMMIGETGQYYRYWQPNKIFPANGGAAFLAGICLLVGSWMSSRPVLVVGYLLPLLGLIALIFSYHRQKNSPKSGT